MTLREAERLARERGYEVGDRLDRRAQVAVLGEYDLPGEAGLAGGSAGAGLDEAARLRVDRGTLQVLTETEWWQRLGLLEDSQHIRRLYTPAMLAQLLHVPVAIVRRWHRRGLIQPAREVRRLPYFDFQEVTTARRLAELLAAGVSPQQIERKLADLVRYAPGVARPLAQLSVIVEGKRILLRQGEGLVEPGGQMRFDFQSRATAEPRASTGETPLATLGAPAPGREELVRMAEDAEDEGDLETAVDLYRAALSSGGAAAELCFRLAELLFRQGETAAACERYYMAVELDPDYVEARASLGCVLAELGKLPLAAAAFEGALASHADYPDAHYHLARVLDELGQRQEARVHWEAFARLSPDSPWAEEARQRLETASA